MALLDEISMLTYITEKKIYYTKIRFAVRSVMPVEAPKRVRLATARIR